MIVTALSVFFLGKNSFRNISLILRTDFNIKVSHTTISNWCANFAPMFGDMRIQLLPLLNLDSDERHTDETVVKIAGVKHYIWFVIDSETRFVVALIYYQLQQRSLPRIIRVPKFEKAVLLSLFFRFWEHLEKGIC